LNYLDISSFLLLLYINNRNTAAAAPDIVPPSTVAIISPYLLEPFITLFPFILAIFLNT